MMNTLSLVPSTPAMAAAPRSASYLDHEAARELGASMATAGVWNQNFGFGFFVNAICDHAKSVVRTWTATPAATKDHSQRESPT